LALLVILIETGTAFHNPNSKMPFLAVRHTILFLSPVRMRYRLFVCVSVPNTSVLYR